MCNENGENTAVTMHHIKPAQKQCISWRHDIVVVRSSGICEEEPPRKPIGQLSADRLPMQQAADS